MNRQTLQHQEMTISIQIKFNLKFDYKFVFHMKANAGAH